MGCGVRGVVRVGPYERSTLCRLFTGDNGCEEIMNKVSGSCS